MANIKLSGILLDPTSEFAVGDKVRFTHKSTTGETIKSAISTLTIPPDGSYSIDLQYGLVLVEYKDIRSNQFRNLGVATVNTDNPATSIPELLNALVPVSSTELIEFQSILSGCVAAQDNAEGFANDSEQSAIDAANSAASVEWSDIRYSKLSNPLTNVLKKNKLIDTLSGALAWERATTATYIDQYGVLQYTAIDEPRQEKKGWLIESNSTNLISYSELLQKVPWQSGAGVNDATLISSSNLAPSGEFNAELYEDASGTIALFNRQVIPGIFNGHVTCSAFFKAGTSTTFGVSLAVTGGTAIVAITSFDSLTKAFLSTPPTGIFFNYEELSNGWFRIVITIDNTDLNNTIIDYRVYPASALDASETGTAIIWGAQIEELPFASSYIPTTSAPTTRVADIISIQGADNIPLLSGQNSISMTVSALGFDSVNRQSIFTAYADDDFNRSMTFWNGDDQTILNYISGVSYPIIVPVSRKGANSLVSTYDSANTVSYVNGVQTSEHTASYTDASDMVSTIYIGQRGGGIYVLNGHISDLRIYDFALNTAEVSFLAGE